MKEAGAPLAWADVSLYQNEFDQLISEAAFDGVISSTELSSTSPEFGTDGYFAKCWVREEQGIFLYKSGSALHEIEPLSEYLACQLAAVLCPTAIPYDLDFYHGRLVSKCPLFTNERVGLAKAARVFGGEEKTIPELLAYFASIGGGDAFRRMCVLDAVILNPDRHYGNFGVLFDNDTMQVLGMAPVFDNNRPAPGARMAHPALPVQAGQGLPHQRQGPADRRDSRRPGGAAHVSVLPAPRDQRKPAAP